MIVFQLFRGSALGYVVSIFWCTATMAHSPDSELGGLSQHPEAVSIEYFDPYYRVPLVSLVVGMNEFIGQKVEAWGFLSSDDGGMFLFPTKEQCETGWVSESVLLRTRGFDRERLEQLWGLHCIPVAVRGTFRFKKFQKPSPEVVDMRITSSSIHEIESIVFL